MHRTTWLTYRRNHFGRLYLPSIRLQRSYAEALAEVRHRHHANPVESLMAYNAPLPASRQDVQLCRQHDLRLHLANWLHLLRWLQVYQMFYGGESTNFTTAGGHFLVACNGSDAVRMAQRRLRGSHGRRSVLVSVISRSDRRQSKHVLQRLRTSTAFGSCSQAQQRGICLSASRWQS